MKLGILMAFLSSFGILGELLFEISELLDFKETSISISFWSLSEFGSESPFDFEELGLSF